MPTMGWQQAKVKDPDPKSGSYPSKGILRADTDSGNEVSLVANVKTTGRNEGLVQIHVVAANGTWTSIALGPDGQVLDLLTGGRTMKANKEVLNERQKTRRAALAG
jgi:hypothetical protein